MFSLDEALDYSIKKILSPVRRRETKRRKTQHLSPIVFGRIKTTEGEAFKTKEAKILLDSGASSTIVSRRLVDKLKWKSGGETKTWDTQGGVFHTKNR